MQVRKWKCGSLPASPMRPLVDVRGCRKHLPRRQRGSRRPVLSADASQIRILAVDDHPLVREGIAGLVGTQADMTVVGEASNGREAIQQFRTHHPDITLMDLQMPEMGGLDALIAIRNECPDASVIVLTTYAGDVQILRALKAGAQAYLLKN